MSAPGKQAALDEPPPEPGRLDRAGLVLETGDRPLDPAPERRLDADVGDADAGADDGSLLDEPQVAELAHLAQVVVAPRAGGRAARGPSGTRAAARPAGGGSRRRARSRLSIVSRSSAGSVGGGGRSAPCAARGSVPAVGAVAGPATPLLGRDQVAVVGLAAVDDLDLGAARRSPIRRGDRLGLGKGRVRRRSRA